MKSKIISIIMIALCLSQHQTANAKGHGVGNGGGGEVEFAGIATEISGWLKARLDDGSLKQKLNLDQAGISANVFYTTFERFQNSPVKFQDDSITLQGYSNSPAGRVCGNSQYPAHILCNNSNWNDAPPQVKYAIVLHEIIGVAGIEKNQGEYSRYPISKNILSFVKRSDKYELAASAENLIIGQDLGYRHVDNASGCIRREANDLKRGYNPGFLGECGDLRGVDMNAIANKLAEAHSTNVRYVFDNMNLSGANLSGLDLRNLIFRGVNFTQANFSGANVSGADFSDANLDFADLIKANLTATRFSRSQLDGTDFSSAQMIGAELVETMAWLAKYDGAVLDDDTTLPPKYSIADFTGTGENQRAIYDPSQNSSVEVIYQGKKIIVNRQTTEVSNASSDDNNPIPFSAPSQVRNASMCFRGNAQMALNFIDGTFQEDDDFCGAANFTNDALKLTRCGNDGEKETYNIIILRCK